MSAFRMIAVSCILAGTVSAAARSDDDRAIEAFGQGVHAYYEGHFAEANTLLSEAIKDGSNDPRPYFFRGIVRQLTGQDQLADADFQKGAEIELTPIGRSFDVDDSLERVQGKVRIVIEQYRREALARAKAAQEKADAEGRTGQAASGGLDPNNLPDVSQIVDSTIPFPEISAKPYFPPAKSAAEVQNADATPPADAVDNASAAPVPAADDPFNTGGNQPAAADSMPMKENAAEAPPADDPFGSGNKGDASGDANPPQGAGDQKQPPADDPFGSGEKGDAGGDSKTPEDAGKQDSKPGDNPFDSKDGSGDSGSDSGGKEDTGSGQTDPFGNG